MSTDTNRRDEFLKENFSEKEINTAIIGLFQKHGIAFLDSEMQNELLSGLISSTRFSNKITIENRLKNFSQNKRAA